jgi:hypothetical protein
MHSLRGKAVELRSKLLLPFVIRVVLMAFYAMLEQERGTHLIILRVAVALFLLGTVNLARLALFPFKQIQSLLGLFPESIRRRSNGESQRVEATSSIILKVFFR